MGFNKKTIRDIELAGRHVLVRADYNVPLKDGRIEDDYRLRCSLPTLQYILSKHPASLVIISHLGRPKGPSDKMASLAPIAARLDKLLDEKVNFIDDCVGPAVTASLNALPEGSVSLLENLRFHPGEEQNNKAFAEAVVAATNAQVFVADGFGVVHRAHASTEAITHLLPSVAGLLVEKEVETLAKVMASPDHPLTAVVGGAKISDKIDVLNRFIEIADCVAVGGALANNFLQAQKISIGASLFDKEALGIAKEVLSRTAKIERQRNFSFMVPVDVVVSKNINGRAPTRVVDVTNHALADIESYPKLPARRTHEIMPGESIFDIGPVSAARIMGAINLSKTVIWSGTLGVAEVRGIAGARDPFGHGTRMAAEAMIGDSNHHANKPFSVVGGGDTVAYIESQKMVADFNHVSTGGSASLELMAGKKLPGVEALENK